MSSNFVNGIKIQNDLNNKKEGPHFDIVTDLRNEIGGVDKLRISPDGAPLGGNMQIGPYNLPYGK